MFSDLLDASITWRSPEQNPSAEREPASIVPSGLNNLKIFGDLEFTDAGWRGRIFDAALFLVIEAKAKAIAEGCKGALGGIGFGGLDGPVIGLAGVCAEAEPKPVPSRIMMVPPVLTFMRTRAMKPQSVTSPRLAAKVRSKWTICLSQPP